jgi:hypothetical protein
MLFTCCASQHGPETTPSDPLHNAYFHRKFGLNDPDKEAAPAPLRPGLTVPMMELQERFIKDVYNICRLVSEAEIPRN